MSSSGSLCRHPPKLASNAALDPDDHETSGSLCCTVMVFGIVHVTGTEAGGANPTADLLGGWGSYLNRWSGLV